MGGWPVAAGADGLDRVRVILKADGPLPCACKPVGRGRPKRARRPVDAQRRC